MGIYDFVRQEGGGLPRIIAFLNLWARESGKIRAFSVVRYEDLRADPSGTLAQVADFLEIPASPAQIATRSITPLTRT